MPLFDTHCHLDINPLWDSLDEVLERARAAGVTRVIAPANDLDSWDAVAGEFLALYDRARGR